MKTLKLTLKKQWFDLIKSGEKKEEYREIKEFFVQRLITTEEKIIFKGIESVSGLYWFYLGLKGNRLKAIYALLDHSGIMFKSFDKIQFTNGYSANSPRITVECKGIRIGTGKPECGAVEGVNYFVIELGEILNQ